MFILPLCSWKYAQHIISLVVVFPKQPLPQLIINTTNIRNWKENTASLSLPKMHRRDFFLTQEHMIFRSPIPSCAWPFIKRSIKHGDHNCKQQMQSLPCPSLQDVNLFCCWCIQGWSDNWDLKISCWIAMVSIQEAINFMWSFFSCPHLPIIPSILYQQSD